MTHYDLKDVSIPTYETGVHSFDSTYVNGGNKPNGCVFRRNSYASLVGFQDMGDLYERELLHIFVKEFYQWHIGDPTVAPRLVDVQDYISGKELCPAVLTIVLEILQMPHDFMRIGDVCFCMVHLPRDTAKQMLSSMHVNSCRKWEEHKRNHPPATRETSRYAWHQPQFVPCSDVQGGHVIVGDKNGKDHAF